MYQKSSMSQKQVGLNNFPYLKVIPIRVRKKGTKKQLLYNVMSSRVELSINCHENTGSQAIHVIALNMSLLSLHFADTI